MTGLRIFGILVGIIIIIAGIYALNFMGYNPEIGHPMMAFGSLVILVSIAALLSWRKYKWRTITSVTITIITILWICSELALSVFADAGLKSAVRSELFLTLNRTRLAKVSELMAGGKNISDLTGIEYCDHLWYLFLDNNQISDISPLLSLHNLRVVYLRRNPLNTKSVEIYIPQLIKKGVQVKR